MKNKDFISAPIPGMSLTTEPGARPWEQPPQLNTIAEVVDFYTEKLSEPEVIYAMLQVVKSNIPILELTKSLTTTHIMKGIHSVDTGMLVQPVIVEMLKTLAELNDIGYVITRKDMEKGMSIDKNIVKEAIEEVRTAGEISMNEGDMEEEKPRGLMARGER